MGAEEFVGMASPPVIGTSVAAKAMGGRYLIRARQALKARPPVLRFYPRGFRAAMDRREATLILGVREHAVIKEAHQRVLTGNHPDASGSHYLTSKINEAKDIFLGSSGALGFPILNLIGTQTSSSAKNNSRMTLSLLHSYTASYSFPTAAERNPSSINSTSVVLTLL